MHAGSSLNDELMRLRTAMWDKQREQADDVRLVLPITHETCSFKAIFTRDAVVSELIAHYRLPLVTVIVAYLVPTF